MTDCFAIVWKQKGQATALEANNSEKTLALKSNLDYTENGRFLFKLYDQDGNCDTYNYNSTTGYLDSVTDDNTGAQINYTYYEIGNPLSYRDGMEMT